MNAMTVATFFLLHFWHFFYVPTTGPWYTGSIWGNVFVVPVVVGLGFIWSKTKFWPLKPLERGVRHLHTKVDSLHDKHDATDARLNELHESVKSLHAKHAELRALLDPHGSGSMAEVPEDAPPSRLWTPSPECTDPAHASHPSESANPS